ncbi:MAG TPA: hypothetical protein VFO49_16990 [Nocardioides sp.]|nr:hypothetical protein [Nocardioides sp.]
MDRASDIRVGLVAGTVGAIAGGIPSTAHALVTGRDPLEASYAAGAILLPHEERRGRLLMSAAVAHGAISLFWGVVLARVLPRRRPVLAGAAAGLAIAAVDLGTVGRRIERIRTLPLGPQLADHAVYGAAVGAVIARARTPWLNRRGGGACPPKAAGPARPLSQDGRSW